MKPLIRKGGLSGGYWLITRYTEGPSGEIVSSQKTDVTEEVEALLRPYKERLAGLNDALLEARALAS